MSSKFVSASENYNYTIADYLSRKGIQPPSSLVPFYIHIVDSNGKIKNIECDEVKISGLQLFINPNSMNFNMSKIINRVQTMTGWIEEHWGEELDAISMQGSTAAFIIGPPNTNDPMERAARVKDVTSTKLYEKINKISSDDAKIRAPFNEFLKLDDISSNTSSFLDAGLTTMKRRQTVGYIQFKQIIKIMENNGCIFDTYGFIKERNFIQLSYDYGSYRGYIESIDTTEDSVNPFKFIYTITFKVERTLYTLMQ
jgi:hypothetical protein